MVLALKNGAEARGICARRLHTNERGRSAAEGGASAGASAGATTDRGPCSSTDLSFDRI